MGDDSNKSALATGLIRKVRENLSKIKIGTIFLVFTAFLLPILFNETVQPLGSPRISTLSTEPLFIYSQPSEDEKGEVIIHYYQISKTIYEIQPPMFSKGPLKCILLLPLRLLGIKCADSLKIDFPENVEIFAPNSGFWEKNPYITVTEEESSSNQIFISSRNNDHIFVKVIPTATIVKTIPFKLYSRENISISCSNPGYTEGFWRDTHGSSLEEVPRIDCSELHLATGWAGSDPDRKIMYDFYELVLSNRGNLDIMGFMSAVRTTHDTRVCEDNKEVNLFDLGSEKQYVRIYLKSGETRRMVIMRQYSEEDSKEKLKSRARRPNEFNFTMAGCNGDWNNHVF